MAARTLGDPDHGKAMGAAEFDDGAGVMLDLFKIDGDVRMRHDAILAPILFI
ncbi:MAG: hypothetical protein WAW96_19120 [Alphaproteobacteria bacterium]